MTATPDDIRAVMAEVLDVPVTRVADDVVLTDLVSDSFRLVEMAIELQEVYDVVLVQADLKDLRTAGQLIELVHSRITP